MTVVDREYSAVLLKHAAFFGENSFSGFIFLKKKAYHLSAYLHFERLT